MTFSGICPSHLLLAAATVLGWSALAHGAPEDEGPPQAGRPLSPAQLAKFARVALAGIGREYPHKPGIVLAGPRSLRSPKALHPAFHGCFDWHSAVHSHWMLVRLLKQCPAKAPLRDEIVSRLTANLTRANLQTEADFFGDESNRHFERTYGWAWLLRLAQELRTFEDERAQHFAAFLRPLEDRIVALTKSFLPKLTCPVRSGEHGDTAFALSLVLDYARVVGDRVFEALALERATHYYAADRDYPLAYEPSGHDFFSAGLNEADLMRRVLEPKAYAAWLDGFLPGLEQRDLDSVAEPAVVSDVGDGRLVHLAGLNLTRAWTLRGIASSLPEGDGRRTYLERLVTAHTEAGLGYVFSGHYEGEHWLASFAVYLLTDAGLGSEWR